MKFKIVDTRGRGEREEEWAEVGYLIVRLTHIGPSGFMTKWGLWALNLSESEVIRRRKIPNQMDYQEKMAETERRYLILYYSYV